MSFVGAFAGGVLSLLAPCGALLLPTFFAYAFSSRGALFRHTALFYVGLCALLVPLGMGASLVSAVLLGYRDVTIVITGSMIIGFGLLEISGRGFSILPARFTGRFRPGTGAVASVGAGMVYGLAGFCAGPLLGGVLTIAATSGNAPLGGALLATYALGIAAPLFGLAWFWDRWQLGRRGWLRGRPLQIGPLHAHSTSLIAGSIFVVLGISLIAFQGGSALSGVYSDLGLGDLGFAMQYWLAEHLNDSAEGFAMLGLAMLLSGWFTTRWFASSHASNRSGRSELASVQKDFAVEGKTDGG